MMSDENDKHRADETRRGRLKSALRENLKRRKVQARERAGMSGAAGNDEPSEAEEDTAKAGG
jgi:hypothetical protein